MGSVPQWLLVNDNGKPAVTFDVYQQDSADSLNLAKEVDAAARCLHAEPTGIDRSFTNGTTRPSSSAPRSARVEEAILIGLAFAALVRPRRSCAIGG